MNPAKAKCTILKICTADEENSRGD